VCVCVLACVRAYESDLVEHAARTADPSVREWLGREQACAALHEKREMRGERRRQGDTFLCPLTLTV